MKRTRRALVLNSPADYKKISKRTVPGTDTSWSMVTVPIVSSDRLLGNIMIDDGALSGILDFEFAGWSDPDEDLGWFCARCWRFGAYDKEAGGLGSREALLPATPM